MKLTELVEASTSRTALKNDSDKSQMADKANDLSMLVTKVRDAVGLEAKKSAAKAMASHFRVGGKEKYLVSVEKCKTPGQVDWLAYNATLKGEGKGVK